MRKAFLSIAVLASLFCAPLSAFAADAEFTAFWTKFQAALKKNDKEAIATMTRLPYLSNEDKKLDHKGFVAYCEKIFDKKTRACLAKEKPVQDKQNWSAFCGEEIFIFEKVNGKYMFTEIGVND